MRVLAAQLVQTERRIANATLSRSSTDGSSSKVVGGRLRAVHNVQRKQQMDRNLTFPVMVEGVMGVIVAKNVEDHMAAHFVHTSIRLTHHARGVRHRRPLLDTIFNMSSKVGYIFMANSKLM